MDKEYTKKLEGIIKQMLTPLKSIPFGIVIDAISGHKVIRFDKSNKNHKRILKDLIKVAKKVGQEINRNGIKKRRVNEVGNAIESFVKNELSAIGYNAQTKRGGYPDLEFETPLGEVHYLECKTFNKKTFNSPLRSFYLSPSSNFKVSKDACHFLISFETIEDKREDDKNIYKVKKWKILTLDLLEVNVKYEFNCNNKELYHTKNILAEGEL